MTFVSIYDTIETAVVGFFRSIFDAPTPGPAKDIEGNLVKIIEGRSIAIGPMLGTGGIVHAVTPAQAAILAPEIIAGAQAAGLRLSLLQALLDGESRDDANAVNPNHQDDTAGETADQKLDHEDAGIEQEDVSTAKGSAGFAGLTDEQIVAKLLDPVYGIGFAAETLKSNITEMAASLLADPSLAATIAKLAPGFMPAEVAGANAYNAGVAGTIASLRSDAPKLTYGIGVLTKAAGWAADLDP